MRIQKISMNSRCISAVFVSGILTSSIGVCSISVAQTVMEKRASEPGLLLTEIDDQDKDIGPIERDWRAVTVSEVTELPLVPGQYEVAPDDTLWKIARRLRFTGISVVQIMEAIFRYNSAAFEEGDISEIVVGSVILLPTEEEVRSEFGAFVSPGIERIEPDRIQSRALISSIRRSALEQERTANLLTRKALDRKERFDSSESSKNNVSPAFALDDYDTSSQQSSSTKSQSSNVSVLLGAFLFGLALFGGLYVYSRRAKKPEQNNDLENDEVTGLDDLSFYFDEEDGVNIKLFDESDREIFPNTADEVSSRFFDSMVDPMIDAEMYLSVGKIDEAIDVLQEERFAKPLDASCRVRLMQILYEERRFRELETIYSEIEKTGDHDSVAAASIILQQSLLDESGSGGQGFVSDLAKFEDEQVKSGFVPDGSEGTSDAKQREGTEVVAGNQSEQLEIKSSALDYNQKSIVGGLAHDTDFDEHNERLANLERTNRMTNSLAQDLPHFDLPKASEVSPDINLDDTVLPSASAHLSVGLDVAAYEGNASPKTPDFEIRASGHDSDSRRSVDAKVDVSESQSQSASEIQEPQYAGGKPTSSLKNESEASFFDGRGPQDKQSSFDSPIQDSHDITELAREKTVGDANRENVADEKEEISSGSHERPLFDELPANDSTAGGYPSEQEIVDRFLDHPPKEDDLKNAQDSLKDLLTSETSLEELVVGDCCLGVVTSLSPLGAHLDIRESIGVLNVNDIAWKRVSDPSSVLDIGDVINVKVLAKDSYTGKYEVGMKQLEDDPWKSSNVSKIKVPRGYWKGQENPENFDNRVAGLEPENSVVSSSTVDADENESLIRVDCAVNHNRISESEAQNKNSVNRRSEKPSLNTDELKPAKNSNPIQTDPIQKVIRTDSSLVSAELDSTEKHLASSSSSEDDGSSDFFDGASSLKQEVINENSKQTLTYDPQTGNEGFDGEILDQPNLEHFHEIHEQGPSGKNVLSKFDNANIENDEARGQNMSDVMNVTANELPDSALGRLETVLDLSPNLVEEVDDNVDLMRNIHASSEKHVNDISEGNKDFSLEQFANSTYESVASELGEDGSDEEVGRLKKYGVGLRQDRDELNLVGVDLVQGAKNTTDGYNEMEKNKYEADLREDVALAEDKRFDGYGYEEKVLEEVAYEDSKDEPSEEEYEDLEGEDEEEYDEEDMEETGEVENEDLEEEYEEEYEDLEDEDEDEDEYDEEDIEERGEKEHDEEEEYEEEYDEEDIEERGEEEYEDLEDEQEYEDLEDEEEYEEEDLEDEYKDLEDEEEYKDLEDEDEDEEEYKDLEREDNVKKLDELDGYARARLEDDSAIVASRVHSSHHEQEFNASVDDRKENIPFGSELEPEDLSDASSLVAFNHDTHERPSVKHTQSDNLSENKNEIVELSATPKTKRIGVFGRLLGLFRPASSGAMESAVEKLPTELDDSVQAFDNAGSSLDNKNKGDELSEFIGNTLTTTQAPMNGEKVIDMTLDSDDFDHIFENENRSEDLTVKDEPSSMNLQNAAHSITDSTGFEDNSPGSQAPPPLVNPEDLGLLQLYDEKEASKNNVAPKMVESEEKSTDLVEELEDLENFLEIQNKLVGHTEVHDKTSLGLLNIDSVEVKFAIVEAYIEEDNKAAALDVLEGIINQQDEYQERARLMVKKL